jgi:uncharacterized BrkB/YihY/UPF0761 family membrane protein
LGVFLLGIVELWASVPAGFVLSLNPIIIGIASSLGAITAAVIVIVIGENIRNRILKSVDKPESSRERLLRKIWNKYGIIGLGLLSPLLFGAPLGVAIGVALGAPRKRLLLWMSVGIIMWTIILVILVLQGINIASTF